MEGKTNIRLVPDIKILVEAYLGYHDSIVGKIHARFKGYLDRMKVEDIFSDAFVDTCDKIRRGTFDLQASEDSLNAYLYQVCYRQACKKVQRNREDRLPEFKSGEDRGLIDEGQLQRLMGVVNVHEGGDEIINACDEAECEHALSVAIGSMKETCRRVLLEHYRDGFSYELIAEGLNRKATAVKMQAKRCKDAFITNNKHLRELCRR